MHMLTYRLVAGDFQKLEPNATHVRCYSYTAYPLKNGRSRKKIFYGLHKKIAVAVHIHTYLSTSAHPVAQSRGGRTREALGPVAALWFVGQISTI